MTALRAANHHLRYLSGAPIQHWVDTLAELGALRAERRHLRERLDACRAYAAVISLGLGLVDLDDVVSVAAAVVAVRDEAGLVPCPRDLRRVIDLLTAAARP